jgi:hypothetical protein
MRFIRRLIRQNLASVYRDQSCAPVVIDFDKWQPARALDEFNVISNTEIGIQFFNIHIFLSGSFVKLPEI